METKTGGLCIIFPKEDTAEILEEYSKDYIQIGTICPAPIAGFVELTLQLK